MDKGIEIINDKVILDKAVWDRIVRVIGNEFGYDENGVIERVCNGGSLDKQEQEALLWE